MKRQRTDKKPHPIIFQVIVIVLIISALGGYIGVLSSNSKKAYSNNTPYSFEELPAKVYGDTMYKADLEKSINFSGNIKRVSDNIGTIVVDGNFTINCKIGSILDKPTDVVTGVEVENFQRGRVIDIEYDEENTMVFVDLATNYLATFAINDTYNNQLQDIIAGAFGTRIKSSGGYLEHVYLSMDYDYASCKYILIYKLLNINNWIYADMKTEISIITKEYINAIYIQPKIIKDITDDYYVILDKIIERDDGSVVTEEKKYKIIDVANGNIIIETYNNYDGTYVIYDKYRGVANVE
ncbi:MAG: hypothetical protein LBE09_04660 [Christensenellaceae bacterium]|jgi:hypothetical protein|nr:hypothetical protein [Christensenellaceae bacterium]